MGLTAGAFLFSLLFSSVSHAQREVAQAPLDPVGAWRCVLYGNPKFGDDRVLLSFAPDHTARMARMSQAGEPSWLLLSEWEVAEGTLTFLDSRTGRHFTAELDRETLSGEWRTLNLLGGWWCSAAEAQSGPGADILRRESGSATAQTRRLIPAIMATPSFPIQAIREAREGRVVLCFIVEPSGEIFEPEFVELSDEIFRATSLDALMRSRYKSWDPRSEGGARPACRSFIYRLDYVY